MFHFFGGSKCQKRRGCCNPIGRELVLSKTPRLLTNRIAASSPVLTGRTTKNLPTRKSFRVTSVCHIMHLHLPYTYTYTMHLHHHALTLTAPAPPKRRTTYARFRNTLDLVLKQTKRRTYDGARRRKPRRRARHHHTKPRIRRILPSSSHQDGHTAEFWAWPHRIPRGMGALRERAIRTSINITHLLFAFTLKRFGKCRTHNELAFWPAAIQYLHRLGSFREHHLHTGLH